MYGILIEKRPNHATSAGQQKKNCCSSVVGPTLSPDSTDAASDSGDSEANDELSTTLALLVGGPVEK